MERPMCVSPERTLRLCGRCSVFGLRSGLVSWRAVTPSSVVPCPYFGKSKHVVTSIERFFCGEGYALELLLLTRHVESW